ncbi:hypothetical protein [Aquiflexum sp.]|uniref:hypothetical protein n=1 Tax=Aquiflexum sp. TaxID=1872584 RepID=UPI0035934616
MQDSSSIAFNHKPNLKAYPIIYYTPETKFAFEGFAYLSWVAQGTERKSNVRFFAVYTQNKQRIFILPWQAYLKNEKMFLDGGFDFRRFPEYFYGIGNQTQEDNRFLYDFTAFTFENKAFFKTYKNIFVGLNTQFLNLWPGDSNLLPAELKSGALGISEGYRFFGLGPSILSDSRDQILSPTKGKYMEFSSQFGMGIMEERNINFIINKLDVRTFTSLNEKTIWANQFLAQYSLGEVPFRSLPTLGGPYLHRGYYQGRFRDNHLLLIQSEIRRSITSRWGVVGFLSAGRVYAGKKDNLLREIHPALGTGLRYQFNKNDKTNIRLDFSITPDSRGVYLFFAEAF